MPAFMIAAAHKSSGKTVISTGLARALSARGQHVQSFKKGPDYIDPMWLRAASGHACYNLDFNTMGPDELKRLFSIKAGGADVALVEANKGLFDGVDLNGSDSNAQLAKILNLPVVLVIDTNGITRGIAPLLQGYQGFDDEINIAGVILNKVGGDRHENKLIAAVKEYTDIEVLGAVHRNKALDIGERHLGLTTPSETNALSEKIDAFGKILEACVDIDRMLERTSYKLAPNTPTLTAPAPVKALRIGIIEDEAFGFYYADDLEAFQEAGAELLVIDALKDTHLPALDGLFVGGGFPEMRAKALTTNIALLKQIKSAVQAGLPTYAECGGLMYLCRSLSFDGEKYAMVGVIDADTIMHKRPQGRGYVGFGETDAHPWGKEGECLAHEFHFASLKNIAQETQYGRKITKGHGIDGANDAIMIHNLVAGFCHLRHTKSNPWVTRFLEFVAAKKNAR